VRACALTVLVLCLFPRAAPPPPSRPHPPLHIVFVPVVPCQNSRGAQIISKTARLTKTRQVRRHFFCTCPAQITASYGRKSRFCFLPAPCFNCATDCLPSCRFIAYFASLLGSSHLVAPHSVSRDTAIVARQAGVLVSGSGLVSPFSLDHSLAGLESLDSERISLQPANLTASYVKR